MTHKEYQFFAYDFSTARPLGRTLPEAMKLEIFSPTWKKIRINNYGSFYLYLFWFLFSRRKYKIYYVLNQGCIVHMSHVISRNPKFSFLGINDFEIGPCWTAPEFRGQGLYPCVLSKIAADYRDDLGKLFIFAEKKNKASLAGITKSGFKYIGSGAKTGFLGIYRITQPAGDEP